MGLRLLEIFLLLLCGDRLETTEYDVYRSQILTTKVNPLAVRVKVNNGRKLTSWTFCFSDNLIYVCQN